MDKTTRFTALIKEHEGILYKVSSIYAKTQTDQKDLYQEVVYQLWKGFDGFRGEAKISTWIYRIALNTSFTYLRKEKKRGYSLALENVNLQYEIVDNTIEEQLQAMYAQIRQLNDVEKGLILLLLEGKKYDEIAEITGLSPSNVGTKISRIKQKLKNQLIKK
jgi:RNA polymerase sigma-70 factor (ECF subfamily)